MKNRSIDDEFSRQLPDASPKDWKQLESRLGIGDLKRKLRGMLWAFPLAMVALTGFSGWQSYELYHTRQRLDELEKVVSVRTTKSPLDDRSDTTYRRVVVYDTIYLTTAMRYPQISNRKVPPEYVNKAIDILKNSLSNNPSLNEENVTSTKSVLVANTENVASTESPTSKVRETQLDNSESRVEAENQPDAVKRTNATVVAEIAPETKVDSALRAISEATADMTEEKHNATSGSSDSLRSLADLSIIIDKPVPEKKTLASSAAPELAKEEKQNKNRTPISVDAGVSAGLLSPLAEGIEEGSRGSLAGLRFALNYTPRWSVVLDMQRNNLRFHKEGDHGYSFLPIVPPPTPGASLNEAEVYEYSSWQFGLGLQYIVLDQYRWKPYLRIGWALQKPAHYLIEYKYIDANDNQSESYFTFRNEPSISDIVQGAVGISYPLGQRLNATVEAAYQRQWKTPDQTPNALGIKVSVLYRLSTSK